MKKYEYSSPYDRREVVYSWATKHGLYKLVATRAFRALLFDKFEIYSSLGRSRYEYRVIYDYVFSKLIELKCYKEEDKIRADKQLEATEEFVFELKLSKSFAEW